MKKNLQFFALAIIVAVSFSSCVRKNFDAPPDTSGYDPGLTVTTTIGDLLAMNGSYNGGDDTMLITQDLTISGIVVADDRSGNFYKRIVIEDNSGAIQLAIGAYSLYNDYPVGRKVYVRLQGLYLGYDGGTPLIGQSVNAQRGIDDITGTNIEDHIVKADVGHAVIPDTVDLADIETFNADYLNRLVYIREAEFADPATAFAEPLATTNLDVEDCSGNTIVARTSNYAQFASYMVPQGKGSFMAIYTVYISTSGYKTPQLIIRDTTDLKLNGVRCGVPTGTVLLGEDFEGVSTTGNLTITGWKNIAEAGNEYFIGSTFSSNKYAKISAYSNGSNSVVSWLITPPVNLVGVVNPALAFETIDGYDDGATLEVMVSTDYNGGSTPGTATWTNLTAAISTGHSTGYASSFTPSGSIDLSAFAASNVYIAFRYTGADPTGTTSDHTTTFEVDNVYITGN